MEEGQESHKHMGGRIGELDPPSQLIRVHIDSQRLKQQALELHDSSPGLLYMLWLLGLCFSGTLNSGNRCMSDSFAC